jgi:hypothetical protein
MTLVLFLTHQSSEKQTSLELKTFFLFIYSSSIHTRVLVRDIVVKALFIYPSQKGELSLWEKSQILSTINCVKKVGVTLVRCEGDFRPCEE